MTDNTNQPKRPSHIIWQVTGQGEKVRWNRIGAAWPNRDGKGFTTIFNAYPVGGRIMMRAAKDTAASLS